MPAIARGRPGGRAGPAGDGIEVERELEPAALTWRPDRPRRPQPTAAPAGHAGGGDGAIGRDPAEGLGRVAGRLAGHRGQALDQRPELVLAEESDHGVAVVVGQPRRLEVESDRQVAHDRRQLTALIDLVAMLAQLVAQLLRVDLVQPLVQRVEGAELAR